MCKCGCEHRTLLSATFLQRLKKGFIWSCPWRIFPNNKLYLLRTKKLLHRDARFIIWYVQRQHKVSDLVKVSRILRYLLEYSFNVNIKSMNKWKWKLDITIFTRVYNWPSLHFDPRSNNQTRSTPIRHYTSKHRTTRPRGCRRAFNPHPRYNTSRSKT